MVEKRVLPTIRPGRAAPSARLSQCPTICQPTPLPNS